MSRLLSLGIAGASLALAACASGSGPSATFSPSLHSQVLRHQALQTNPLEVVVIPFPPGRTIKLIANLVNPDLSNAQEPQSYELSPANPGCTLSAVTPGVNTLSCKLTFAIYVPRNVVLVSDQTTADEAYVPLPRPSEPLKIGIENRQVYDGVFTVTGVTPYATGEWSNVGGGSIQVTRSGEVVANARDIFGYALLGGPLGVEMARNNAPYQVRSAGSGVFFITPQQPGKQRGELLLSSYCQQAPPTQRCHEFFPVSSDVRLNGP